MTTRQTLTAAEKKAAKKKKAAELAKRSAEHKAKKVNDAKIAAIGKPRGANEQAVYDSIVAQAHKAVDLWVGADKKNASAGAIAISALVQAHEIGFFGNNLNLSNWHKIGQSSKKLATKAYNLILVDLFGIEKPSLADRQRLVRIRIIVPAIIKSGGSAVIELSDDMVMLSADTDMFKKSGSPAKVSGGKVGLSIKMLETGARSILAKDLPKRAPQTPSADGTDFAKVSTDKVTIELTKRVRGAQPDLFNTSEKLVLQELLVQLLGLFAAKNNGELVTETVTSIYEAHRQAA